MLEGRYGGRNEIILVCDYRNTHTKGVFYEAMRIADARCKLKSLYPKIRL
ncbi:MAG: hypothetical protein ACRC1K_04985 [Planctomycetia bacterium]